MKIVVLTGGLSPERDVSLTSGSLIANALMEAGHRVLLLDVYEGMSGTIDSDLDTFFHSNTAKPYIYSVPDVEPDLEAIKRRNGNRDTLIGPNVLKLCRYADTVFIALHGDMGENGQLQALFDIYRIKYTGTGYIGSLLAMDKDLSKKMFVQNKIPTAQWFMVGNPEQATDAYQKIGLPCVIKPCSAGSSIGVSIAHNKEELLYAINKAFKVDTKVMVEEYVPGREFSVGILDGTPLPVIEIIPRQGFYDYKNKYQSGLTQEVCPANLSEPDTKRVQALALKVHTELQLGTYSRIDFILNEDGEFLCLEANTLPGMTPTSLLPQEASAKGITYVELCDRIIHLTLD